MAFAAPQGPLSGVLATVDVTTDDGLDASSLFARRVAELGGVVSGRLSGRVTHAVFRGPPEALRSLHDRLRRVGAGGAAVVGVSWLAACLGARARAAEAPHALPRPPDTLASLLATPRAGGGSAAKRRAVQPPAAFGARS